ncbi:magnesium and cobalt transport protein CorA [Sphingorhabdus arenilitoris]|uniref:Magnesium and cobalt transport protein CorA n=1 Tax=Sphingorhabdus arenilitoris TaxID=1490041 RepID=A0ABV8RI06_9SPHN
MTLIAARVYRDGRLLTDVSLDQASAKLEKAGDFVWIGLHEPDDQELDLVRKQFGLHELAVEDALDPKHLPKMESYGDHLFVVARTMLLEGPHGQERIAYGNTAIFVGRQFIITVRHGSDRGHNPVRKQLEATPWLLKNGPDYVLHAILDFIVDGYFEVIDLVEEGVLAMEDRSFDHFLNREETARLFSLRRDLFRLQRILGPMEDLAGRFINIDLPQIDHEIDPYFRDLADHVRRVSYRVAGLRDTLTSVIETSGLLEQQRQGVITRQLAAWAAILAVPTAIAGIYGMNFEHMPELGWEYGYAAVWGMMLIICVTLYIRFKRAGWL